MLKAPVQEPSAAQELDPVESHERVKVSPEETTNSSTLTSTINPSGAEPPERTACTHDINLMKVVSGAAKAEADSSSNAATTALEITLRLMTELTQTTAARICIYTSTTSALSLSFSPNPSL